jgi:hypothetical protein
MRRHVAVWHSAGSQETSVKSVLAALLPMCVALAGVPWTSYAQASNAPARQVATVTYGGGERLQGSGRIVEEPRPLPAFQAVHVDGPVRVELQASDRDAVTVRFDDNLVSLVETRVVDGNRAVLEIGVRPGAAFRAARAPVVVVGFRALGELVLRGSGDVRADRIDADDFALSMSGSGDTRIESLRAARLAAVLAGSGDLVVRGGRADEQAFRLSGSGDVHAGRLEGRRVMVSVRGSGDAVVHATETLDATIAGSGDVAYRGNPRITQRIRGSGSVRPAQ